MDLLLLAILRKYNITSLELESGDLESAEWELVDGIRVGLETLGNYDDPNATLTVKIIPRDYSEAL